jgi:hypothetical protein
MPLSPDFEENNSKVKKDGKTSNNNTKNKINILKIHYMLTVLG